MRIITILTFIFLSLNCYSFDVAYIDILNVDSKKTIDVGDSHEFEIVLAPWNKDDNLDKSLILEDKLNDSLFVTRVYKSSRSKNNYDALEIDLKTLKQNFTFLKSKTTANTKFLAVVKAFAYGSDAVEIAKYLAS